MIGTKFGSYRIDSKLGEGGMGVVYRATDTELDRPVAIKTLISSSDEESVARFMREAKAASRLQHPAIITIHQFGVEGEMRFIVMEYVEGKTLKSIINGQPMRLNQLCEIAIQVADGLAMAHEMHIIHRDMKAENVMVTPRGQVKILDFGLAKLKEPEKTGDDAATVYQTQVGVIMGTISHMSPEQALGTEVDPRADIFSFGVVLYEMATGKMPFDGPSPQATLARILNQEPTPVRELNPQAPQDLEKLINQCLQKDREKRPSALDVRDRLKNIQASLSVGNLVSGIHATVAMPASTAAAAAAAPALAPAPAKVPEAEKPEPVKIAQVKTEEKKLRAIYTATRAVRWLVWVGSLSVPLAFLAYFLISGGVIRAQVVEGTAFMAFVNAVVQPPMRMAENIFTFRTVVNGWNFMLLGLMVVAFMLRHVVILPFEKLENWAKTKVVKLKAAAAPVVTLSATERASSNRLSMLREYAETKKALFQEKRKLSFLSIDVVGSTKMKIGEDKLTIEHAFAEYKKFVERILKKNNIWKVAWTPDGIMCAFFSTNDAVRAAQEVLRDLRWFNDGVHQLKMPFNVRCGVNTGEVVFPEDKNMEEISDETIDVAGHMQKYAAHGAIWMARELVQEITDPKGFNTVDDQLVDGRIPVSWRADGLGASAPRGASTPSEH
jgi:class 3 adenylate cyclase/predicted Ser/Thr protein kinase